jgi:sialate O-acetylesterase
VLKTKSDGGFMSKPEDLRLVLGDKTSLPLAGQWKGQLAVDARPPHPLPLAYENWPVMPTVLYEGMLAPVAPFSIAGAIWYQGEQNSPRGYQYRKILPAMIADWRKLFAQGDFPFYIVGLPAFKPRSATPVEGDEWTETRESQALTRPAFPTPAWRSPSTQAMRTTFTRRTNSLWASALPCARWPITTAKRSCIQVRL